MLRGIIYGHGLKLCIVSPDCAERHRHLHMKIYSYAMVYCNFVETAILTLTAKIWLHLSSNSSMVLGLSAPVRHGRIMFGGIEFLKSNNNKDAKRQHTHTLTYTYILGDNRWSLHKEQFMLYTGHGSIYNSWQYIRKSKLTAKLKYYCNLFSLACYFKTCIDWCFAQSVC